MSTRQTTPSTKRSTAELPSVPSIPSLTHASAPLDTTRQDATKSPRQRAPTVERSTAERTSDSKATSPVNVRVLAKRSLAVIGNALELHAMISSTLELRAWSYICIWLLIIALHVACTGFLYALARVYWLLATPRMEYYAHFAAGEQSVYLHPAGAIFIFIGVLHGLQLLSIVFATLRARAFALPNDDTPGVYAMLTSLATRLAHSSHLVAIVAACCLRVLARPLRMLLAVWRFIFSRGGVFGIKSRDFRFVFTMRKLIEVVFQTFQANRSSELLSRSWLNDLLVTLVVLNCWSTPALQRIFRSHVAKERIACLLIDALLNVGSSIAVPLAIFWSYYQEISPVTLTFPSTLVYDTLWFSRLRMESQLLFSMSVLDISSRLVPHVSIYCSLTDVVSLIQRARSNHRRSLTRVFAHTETSARAQSPAPLAAAVSQNRLRNSTDGVGATKERQVHSARRRQNAMHLLFVVWGLAVAVLHLRARLRAGDEVAALGCKQASSSWFATGFPCSVYQYNCYRHGVTSPTDEALAHLDSKSLVFFSITHCCTLRMPHRTQQFNNLVGFLLFNVTIAEWTKESSISATQHPSLTVLVIARANMTRLPDGMLEPLPPRLTAVQLTRTNLTTLPANLHQKWHPLASFFVELSLIREFPTTLLSLPVATLSLYGNKIEKIPELTKISRRFGGFIISANPLAELPDQLAASTAFGLFSAERTLIRTVPAWATTAVKSKMYLFGTPYCEAQAVDASVDDSESSQVTCLARSSRSSGRLPLDLLSLQAPL